MLLSDVKQMKKLLLIQALSKQNLSKQNAWEDVAKWCGLDPAINLGKKASAECLIIALENREWTVERLRECLQALELWEAFSIICEPEKLRLVKQPYCVESDDCFMEGDTLCVRAGGKLNLKIEAVGCPIPSFQWICDNNPLPLSTKSELIIPNFSEKMEGLYYCSVKQLQDFGNPNIITSQDVSVKIKYAVHSEAPQILSYSPVAKCELVWGEDLEAIVNVSPGSKTTFSWWHKSERLRECKSELLRIQNVTEKNAGRYECRVKNQYGESSKEFEFQVRPLPTEKRALIVANSKYKTNELLTPPTDAEALYQCLTEFGFQCCKRENLNANVMKKEIKDFFKTLKRSAYVLFYFGGHGLMQSNVLYMAGCDTDFTMVQEDHVVPILALEDVMACHPLLFISIFDMCQEQIRQNCLEPKQSDKQWTCNVIQCFSTSQNRKALEPQENQPGSKNSVYVKHLIDVMQGFRNLPFQEMIVDVNKRVDEEIGLNQKPMFHIIGNPPPFKLSDPARDRGMSAKERNVDGCNYVVGARR